MITGILFGVTFAGVAVALARRMGPPPKDQPLLALLLAAAAAVYVGASLGDPGVSALLPALGFIPFLALAVVGLENRRILALGWLLHTGWDAAHLIPLMASPLPHWYEIGCLVVDPLIAGYLLATREEAR